MFEKTGGIKRYIKVAFWGPLKEGKTCAGLSFPGPIKVIDSEKGTHLYDDRYEFGREDVIRWKEIGPVMDYLKAHPPGTLLVDSITPLYSDLVEEVGAAAKNRTARDFLTQLDWGIIKRKFRGFLRLLLELPCHVVVTARAKDEYENLKNSRTGEDESKKTGDIVADVDRALSYDMDFIIRCFVEDPNPKGTKPKDKDLSKVKFMLQVTGSRRAEVPKYALYDVTKKKVWDVVFADLAKKLSIGKDAEIKATVAEIALPVEPVKTDAPAIPTHDEKMAEINDFTASMTKPSGSGSRPGREKLQDATDEDLKTLMTRAGDLKWPDGSKFSAQDGRALILARYGIESRKEMKKPEVDELYVAFGEILAGRSQLVRRGDGVPEIVGVVPVSGMTG